MRFLRSTFCALLVLAALLFTGYSAAASACCHHEPVSACESGEPAHEEEHDCHCVCHQTFVHELSAPRALAARALGERHVFAEIADIPPDAVPLGIEHPPQIA